MISKLVHLSNPEKDRRKEFIIFWGDFFTYNSSYPPFFLYQPFDFAST